SNDEDRQAESCYHIGQIDHLVWKPYRTGAVLRLRKESKRFTSMKEWGDGRGCGMTRDMLQSPGDLTVEAADLDFLRTKEIPDDLVRRDWEDPMLLAWFNGKSGAFSPRWNAVTRPN